MPETTAITRRDIRGFPELNDVQPRTAAAPALHKRAIQPRAVEAQFSEAALHDVAGAIAMHIDPDNTQLTQSVYEDLVSLNTALFAIQFANSGLNLTDACNQFRQPSTQLQLQDAALNPTQAGDIICFAAMYGLNFGMSTMDLLNKIETIIYALQIGQNFTTDLGRLCSILDLSFAGYLGIDSNKIKNDTCGTVNGTNITTSPPTSSTSPPLSTGFVTVGTIGSNGMAPTGEPGPWSNSTPMSPPLWTGTAGTVGTGGAWPTGEGGPWSNTSGSEATTTLNGASGTGAPWWSPTGAAGSGSGNETNGSPGNTTAQGPSGNGTEPGTLGNATETGWSGNGTASGVGATGTGMPWGTGWATGTGLVSNGTGPLPTGTGVYHNGSLSAPVGTGIPYGTGLPEGTAVSYDTSIYGYTTETPNITDSIYPQGVPVTPTLAPYYPEWETSTVNKNVVRH